MALDSHDPEREQDVLEPTRSIYAMTRSEIARGLANRFVHSRPYIFLYLSMAALSVATVVLSLLEDCPGLAFYILEVIINAAMILEVAIRFVAFGRQFWNSHFNILDLILSIFCVVTLVVLTFASCRTGKGEALLDTMYLVARNVVQVGRLAALMRQSGQSIFSRPKPIDINSVHRTGHGGLDFDTESDDDEDLRRPLVREPVLFDADDQDATSPRAPLSEMPLAAQAVRERDEQDLWAELG